MNSYERPPDRAISYSPPPPPPPAKDRQPSLKTISPVSNVSKSFNNPSPVRRKPLPATAHPAPRAVLHPEVNASEKSVVDSVSSVHNRADSTRSTDQLKDLITPSRDPTPTPDNINTYDEAERFAGQEVSFPANLHSPPRAVGFSRRGAVDGAIDQIVIPEEDMALKPGVRPAPLRTDSNTSTKSLSADKKPQTPSSKFTSFFTRKPVASPSTESSVTEISDQGKSPLPSPYPQSPYTSINSASGYAPVTNGVKDPTSHPSQSSIDFDMAYVTSPTSSDMAGRCVQLEAELRDISTELAGSIKREMDLEDMVERLQSESALATTGIAADRTSDYFSDSGTSSIRPATSELNPKEEIERIKRESEQHRAQLRVELSQKWQSEIASKRSLESHVQLLEQRLTQHRRDTNESSDISAKAKELENALEDSRRRLNEERQTKENFEDLLTALRVDLEQHRNERDNLRDEVVPQLRARIEGLESTLSDAQKSPYDAARMQQEMQALKEENAALQSARSMNSQFGPISEEVLPGSFSQNKGVNRSNSTFGRSNSRAGGLQRNGSVVNRSPIENAQGLAEHLKAVEQQRDALHSAVKYLLQRQAYQNKNYEKRLKLTEAERDRANDDGARRGGYEREVRALRAEINLLRTRADEAMEQKWQCEKGLAGLKMDLDRSKQETNSLHKLLQARDNSAPEALSSKLEEALQQLQQQRNQVRDSESILSIEAEKQLADQLEQSAVRSESLASQVRKQLQANGSLRNRLKEAIAKGERDQHASADRINDLQSKLRKLEDTITSAQLQSETAVMKHEEDLRVLKASHNAQLMRSKTGSKSPNLLPPGSTTAPLSPLFANTTKAPRLDRTSTGLGVNLHEALKTEYLERKVEELEKALADAESEMGEVIGRMNTAQIGVAELESERDEALRRTRKLEAAIQAEREKVRQLTIDDSYPSDY